MEGYMSHLTVLTVKVKDLLLARRDAAKLGWKVTHEKSFTNRFDNKTVTNVLAVRNEQDQIRLLIDPKNGDVIHDSYLFGTEVSKFMTSYAESFIRASAEREGGYVKNRGINQAGETVLEVCFA
jgi:hypothetical protein